ncbi:MAG: hypothetical protein ACI9OF_000530, partial [Saprospiraceae bacterium]
HEARDCCRLTALIRLMQSIMLRQKLSLGVD